MCFFHRPRPLSQDQGEKPGGGPPGTKTPAELAQEDAAKAKQQVDKLRTAVDKTEEIEIEPCDDCPLQRADNEQFTNIN